MPDSGLTPVRTPFVITTPTDNRPTDTYRPTNGEKFELGEKKLPTPDTLEVYTALNQKPYAFEYFGIQSDNMPTYNSWAHIVDEYVQQEMAKHSYKDSLDTYKEIMGSISSSLGLGDNVIGATRFRKIAQYIRDVIGPMQRIEIRKQRILYGKS